MDDIQNQDQMKPNPVSVPTGRVEGEPTSVNSETTKNIESLEVLDSEPTPELDSEVEQVGVKTVTDDKPVIHPDAKAKGLSHTIPDVIDHDYKIYLTSKEVALRDFATGNVNETKPWRALVLLKNIAKQLLGTNQPQEVH